MPFDIRLYKDLRAIWCTSEAQCWFRARKLDLYWLMGISCFQSALQSVALTSCVASRNLRVGAGSRRGHWDPMLSCCSSVHEKTGGRLWDAETAKVNLVTSILLIYFLTILSHDSIFFSSWHANMEIFAHLPVITSVLHWWPALMSDNRNITVYYFWSMQLGRKMFINLILHAWWIIKISIPAQK